MNYRISSRTLFRNINTNLGFLSYDMAKVNNQIATGKKVNKPSDDPTGGALIMDMRTVLADIDQYNKDVAISDDWLNQSESVIQNMKTVVERANELAEQMSTDTYKPENMDVAAQEVAKLMEGLIKMGNTRIGERYIFSGQKTEVMPFLDQMNIHDPQKDSGNSTSYTGLIKAPKDRTYVPRPDLAAQTKTYLAEITKAGSIGGYTQASGTINPGTNAGLTFTATQGYQGSAGNGITVTYAMDALNPNIPTYANVTAAGPPATITVYLRNDGVNVQADAYEVMAAVANDVGGVPPGAAPASQYVTASLAPGSNGTAIVGPLPQTTTLAGGSENGDSFARVVADPQGANNAIQFIAQTNGVAGNGIEIQYFNAGANQTLQIPPPSPPWPAPAANQIFVSLATDATGKVTSTANDVINYIKTDPGAGAAAARALVSVKLPPQGAGSGIIDIAATPAPPATNPISYRTAGGVDDGALFRVSEDGGLTWGEVNAFNTSSATDPGTIYNNHLGHAIMTTAFPDTNQNVQFTARDFGTAGNNLQVVYDLTGGAIPTFTDDLATDPNHPTLRVHLPAAGATAQQIVDAINGTGVPATAPSRLVSASLADYRVGGNGTVNVAMAGTFLSGADPNVTALGNATLATSFHYQPPASNPNVVFTAVNHGTAGNQVKVEYKNLGAGLPLALSVTGTTLTIQLATDAQGNVTTTANDIVALVNNNYFVNGQGALVRANLAAYPDGGGVVQTMEATALSGGDNTEEIQNHGAKIRFEGDGSALQVGDRFMVGVDYYQGDEKDINLNSNNVTRVKSNVTGSEVLGATGASDNILDNLSRLKFALEKHDTGLVAAELPHVQDSLDKLTTQMAQVGVRLTRNQFTYNILESNKVNSTDRMSRVEDLDITDAVTNLQTKQTAYQASLASTALITKLSLVDYIR